MTDEPIISSDQPPTAEAQVTTPSQLYIPPVAMAIHAHPDDQEFSAAGTLAYWASQGSHIISVTVTQGDAGNNDPDKDGRYKPELARLRQVEQTAANQVLGIKESIFMGYADGELAPTLELRRELTRLIRRYSPEVVLIGDPTAFFYGNSYVNHPDHRAAAEAGLYAVFPSACTRLIFPELLTEGLMPHQVKYLYMHGTTEANTWVDISKTIDLKIKALKQHKSQIGDWDVDKEMREWAQSDAKAHGLEYAEAFRVMSLFEA